MDDEQFYIRSCRVAFCKLSKLEGTLFFIHKRPTVYGVIELLYALSAIATADGPHPQLP